MDSLRLEVPGLPAELQGFQSLDSAGARAQITNMKIFLRTCASTLRSLIINN